MFSRLSFIAFMALCLFSGNAFAQCASPVGAAGDMAYNDSEYVMQWCDGTNWIGTGNPPYIPNAVTFDGTNDYLVENPATVYSDTDRMTGSFWVKTTMGAVDGLIYRALPGNIVNIEFLPSNNLRVIIENGTNGNSIFNEQISGLKDGQWHHIIFSFDASDGNRHIYIDDSVGTPTFNTTSTFPISTTTEHVIGAKTTAGADKFDGEIADFWLDFNTYIDLSVAANRRQFIDANGWPVDLGTDGSKGTGAIPDIYLSGDTAAWHTNKGTGGGFTENGALTDALTDPGENMGPTGGLIGWWKMDEIAGGTAADSSGNGNNGNLTGGLTLPGDAIDGTIKGAYNVSGNRDVAVPHSGSLLTPSQFTFAAWVQFGKDGQTQRIVSKGSDILLELTGNLALKVAGGGTLVDTPFNPTPGEWVHITASHDDPGDEAKIYVNGVLMNTNSTALSYTPAAGNLNFANRTGTLAVDDIRYYDRVLSDAEVTELYETGYPCKNPVAQRDGDTTYNTTSHVPQYCNLREWQAMDIIGGDGGAGCTNPVGVEGDTFYNSTSNAMTYCEGDEWIAIGEF